MRPARTRLVPGTFVIALAALTGACEEHEFHPPSEEARVAQADSAYSPALFDSVNWESPDRRLEAGNLVYADECRRCHGPLGRGDTEYAERNDIDVPSLVEPDWKFDGAADSVRYSIFVGHVGGMPQWGVGRLSPRQIDAVTAYLLEQLRPEVLGNEPVPDAP